MSPSAPRVLVVGPSWVGDMVMAQSLFCALKQHQPDMQIDVLAPGWSLPLLKRMPQVRAGIEMPLTHGELGLRRRWRLGRSLRGNYEQAIVLPGSLKSALVPFFAGIKQRTAFLGEQRYGLINDIRALDKEVLPMTVQRFVALGQAATDAQPPRFTAPRLRVDADNQQYLVQTLGLSLLKPAVALMPGAEYGPAKQWPLAHFAALARELVAQGQQVWVLGSNKDHAAGEAIAQQAGSSREVLNLCGRTQLVDAVDLIALCAAAVSNDSGLMHIAAALDIPSIALYGSSTPRHTPPLSDKAQVIYLALECSPCFKRVCPLGHTRCLTEISPGQVLSVLTDMEAIQ
ncbi:MAG: lipopolysaccharide heptosyltransferase II [Halothiobacillaceae bacterium]|nr:lipopolysaccharide heptosyltransferase II [Halothiobacillaceae bacterium]